MTRVRFATARALFEAFPGNITGIEAEPTDEFPLEFLRRLASQGKLEDAVSFCAYLLPRREAVWWACRSARALLGTVGDRKAAGLQVAEAWVHEPDAEHMQAARDVGTRGDSDDPMTWLALAAGWSGGMLVSHPKAPVAVPPYMTARAARVAVLLCARSVSPAQRPARIRACIEDGIRLAESGL